MELRCSRGESELEKFIVDFVYEKVTERVRLHLSDVITVRPSRLYKKGGAFLLATLWCNVLQHKANFPPVEFSYVAHKVANTAGKQQEILELNVDKDAVQFFVDMSAGSLTVSGQYVYDWFTAHFEQLLVNFDEVFAQNWTFSATPSGDLPAPIAHDRRKDEKAETESYLLLESRGHWKAHSDLLTRAAESRSREVPEISDLLLEKPSTWSAQEVDHHLEQLSQCGGLFDGYRYIYTLWRSTLHHWLTCNDGGYLYIASCLLDENRLGDLIDIAIQHRQYSNVHIAAIYTDVRCDPYSQSSESSCGAIQRSVLKRYDAGQQAYAEQFVLQRITYPVRVSLGTAFTARVTSDGRAEVLLTGANYHGRDLAVGRMSSVMFIRTSRELFTERYLKPLEVPAVTPVDH